MTLKEWLYSGLILETRCGIKYLVVGSALYSMTEFSMLDECYNDDLTDMFNVDMDIVKIYYPKRGSLRNVLEKCNNLVLCKEINQYE